jgi:hypothetical protein
MLTSSLCSARGFEHLAGGGAVYEQCGGAEDFFGKSGVGGKGGVRGFEQGGLRGEACVGGDALCGLNGGAFGDLLAVERGDAAGEQREGGAFVGE